MDMHEAMRMQAVLTETAETQKQLLAQAAVLAEMQKQENAQLRHQLMQATSALQQVAQCLEQGGQRMGQDALRVIDTGSRQVLKDNSVGALEQVHRQAGETARQLQQAANAAGEQGRQLSHAQTALVWKSLAVLTLGGLLLTVGTAVWAWNNKKEAQRYQVDAEINRLISQSDVVQCGERLCANVDLKAGRTGDKQQYRPVKPR